MKNRVIRLTTKAATAMAIAGTVVSTMSMSVMAAESDREHVHESPVYAELVPEAQCIDNFDEIEYINVEGYDPVCRTTYVPEAQVIIGDAPIIPEIISEDESGKTIAQIVPKAQYIDDLNETEYVNRDGNEEIRTQAVPDVAPYINNGPELHKEMVPTAPAIIGSAPKDTESPAEQENVTPSEIQAVSPEKKPEPEKVTLSKPETIPHYGDIKRCYFEKGPNVALCMFILYHPTPLGYDVIEYMEQTLKEGDRGYTIDGVYYDCPENDPYFKDKNILYSADAFKNFR